MLKVQAILIGLVFLFGVSLGVCQPNEILVTRTDGGLIPPAFCYDGSSFHCKKGDKLIGCTECFAIGSLETIEVS